ncbi:MAG: sialidase family protein, partial [Cyclobacteriaceae bacterium]
RDGGFDIWMSRRDGPNCPWQAPVKIGPPISTNLYNEGDPEFTADGRVLFFGSDGPGGEGSGDIFLSRQTDPNDDLAWDEPVNLGPHVNTELHESNPWFVAAEGGGTLYFSRSVDGSPPTGDIYKVSMNRDGQTKGPAVFVTELNVPVPIGDHAPTVRADGRELIFWSGGAAGSRPGGVGLADLWVSTRQSVNDPWSAPRNLGMPVNSPFAELSATLTHDGRTLFFTSARPGGLGLPDLWMSTRGPSAEAEGDRSTQCPPLLTK